MDITKKTLDQLKVLVYDQMVLMETSQANLKMINAEIGKRENEPKKDKEEEKK